MDAVAQHLDSDFGIRILAPPFKGIPEPDDPPLGSNPGIGENGGIFCHANTWAVIAEALLGNGDRAYRYYRQLLPEIVSERAGADHYGREPYVYVSSIVGPVSDRFGEGGISWLTGTSNWMTVAVQHHILGLRPTLEGLRLHPCLPASLRTVKIRRRFRGCRYEIDIDHARRERVQLFVDGKPMKGDLLPLRPGGDCRVRCEC
jgi:cellobiose phosphorylase